MNKELEDISIQLEIIARQLCFLNKNHYETELGWVENRRKK